MWFDSLLASWKSASSRSRRPQPKPARRSTRLVLEHLEDRSLPSNYSAATASDLIADINTANKAGGANTITLVPTTAPYVLTAVNNRTNAGNALPVIAANDNLTIIGNGDTIEGRLGAVACRLFDVAPGAALTLQNMTVTGFGGWLGNGSAVPQGGAIYSQGALTLNGTILEGNVAAGEGGAVFIALGGTANINNTTFMDNRAVGLATTSSSGGFSPPESYGGALYAAGGTVTLSSDTVLSNYTASASEYDSASNGVSNKSWGYGGGIYIGPSATVYIDPFTVANTINNTDSSGTNGSTANIDAKYILT